MTHAGSSIAGNQASFEAIAEQERSGIVGAAAALRSAGLPCPEVSVDPRRPRILPATSPASRSACRGFHVLRSVMAGIGVCDMRTCLSVLATVIGHQHDKG